MPCRCCIVEILDGNSGFASLRRVCFAGAAHSPYGSLFPAKSDGERNGRNGRRLGRRRANDYHHGAFGQRYAKSRGGNGSGRWFCQSQGTDFAKLYRMRLPVKVLRVFALVVVLTIGAGFMPDTAGCGGGGLCQCPAGENRAGKAEETPVHFQRRKESLSGSGKGIGKRT